MNKQELREAFDKKTNAETEGNKEIAWRLVKLGYDLRQPVIDEMGKRIAELEAVLKGER